MGWPDENVEKEDVPPELEGGQGQAGQCRERGGSDILKLNLGGHRKGADRTSPFWVYVNASC